MKLRPVLGCALGLLVAVGVVFACGSEEEPAIPPDPIVDGDGGPGGFDANGLDANVDPDVWTQCPEEGKDGALVVEATTLAMRIELGAPAQTLQFVAKSKATGQKVPAVWTLNAPDVGAIDDSGLFTASGRAGGAVKITARYQVGRGSAELSIVLHAVDNADAVTAQEKSQLTAAGAGLPDPNWKIDYPNDKAIFPGGTRPPEIHSVESALAPTKYFVRITSSHFEYEGFFPLQPQIAISQAAWDALASTLQGGSATVELSKLVGTQKYGPKTQTWQVARGTMHGSIYYSTYDSPLANNDGAIMRIKGRSEQPEVVIGNCTVCHSVSSNGTTLAAANHSGAGGIFDIQPDGAAPVMGWNDPEKTAFAGFSPNGDVFVVHGAPGGSWPPNTPGTNRLWTSALMTKGGRVIRDSGIDSYYAQTPVFSGDGRLLAFVDRSAAAPYASKLALLHYDPTARTFSDYEVLATPPAGRHYAWPSFSPDGKFVVYQDGVGDDLASWNANTGKLWMVNVQTKVKTLLTSLNGDGAMPGGARDEDLNFFPTFAPVPSGGYFWVMFTSRRTYGNRLTGARDSTKRLWAAAFDVNAQDGTDPTHPAFFVPGQELASGNSRGSWVLDPCKASGGTCATGDECCDGFCSADPQKPGAFICGTKNACCSHEFDKCTTTADCCAPSLSCLAGRCTLTQP